MSVANAKNTRARVLVPVSKPSVGPYVCSQEFVASDGSTSSRLKQVDDKWIVARLERWGAQDSLPMVGPKKGAILQDLVREYKPRRVLEARSQGPPIRDRFSGRTLTTAQALSLFNPPPPPHPVLVPPLTCLFLDEDLIVRALFA